MVLVHDSKSLEILKGHEPWSILGPSKLPTGIPRVDNQLLSHSHECSPDA